MVRGRKHKNEWKGNFQVWHKTDIKSGKNIYTTAHFGTFFNTHKCINWINADLNHQIIEECWYVISVTLGPGRCVKKHSLVRLHISRYMSQSNLRVQNFKISPLQDFGYNDFWGTGVRFGHFDWGVLLRLNLETNLDNQSWQPIFITNLVTQSWKPILTTNLENQS